MQPTDFILTSHLIFMYKQCLYLELFKITDIFRWITLFISNIDKSQPDSLTMSPDNLHSWVWELFRLYKHVQIIKTMYKYFIAARILLVFLPFMGYIHPDEFFQSVEVIAGMASKTMRSQSRLKFCFQVNSWTWNTNWHGSSTSRLQFAAWLCPISLWGSHTKSYSESTISSNYW